MQIALTATVAGEVRIQLLRDKPPAAVPRVPELPLLVNSSELQEMTTMKRETVRPGFGVVSSRVRFGRAARRAVREVGAVLDQSERARCVFLTGTLPGGSERALWALAAWSGWVVQTVQQWVRDFAPGARYFGVWEYQKRGALHLHLCVECPTKSTATQLKRRWKARWILALDGVSERSGVDVYERQDGTTWAGAKWITRTDAQTVELSVANYLSKYLSKGSCKRRAGCEYPPSAWWFASSELKLARKELRRTVQVRLLSGSGAQELFERLGGLLVDLVGSAFYYVSPVDDLVKGLVAQVPAVVASLFFDSIAPLLRALEPSGGWGADSEVPAPRVVAQFFAGRLFATTS